MNDWLETLQGWLNKAGDTYKRIKDTEVSLPIQPIGGATTYATAGQYLPTEKTTTSKRVREAMTMAAAPALAISASTVGIPATVGGLVGGAATGYIGGQLGENTIAALGGDENAQKMGHDFGEFLGATPGAKVGSKVTQLPIVDGTKALYKVTTNPELRQAVKTATSAKDYNQNVSIIDKQLKRDVIDNDDGFILSKGVNHARFGTEGKGTLNTGASVSIGAKKDGTFGLNLGGGADSPKSVAELKQVMSELPTGSTISGDAHTPSVALHFRNRFNNKQYSKLIDEINSGKFDISEYPTWTGQFDGMSPDAMSMLGRMAKDNPSVYHIEYGTTPAGQFNHLAKPEGRNAYIYDLWQQYRNGSLDINSYKSQVDQWLSGIGLKSSYIDENGTVQIAQPFLVRNKQGGKLNKKSQGN